MQIAAILSVAETADDFSVAPNGSLTERTGANANVLNARVDVLGRSLLDRALAKIDRFGVCSRTIVPHGDGNQLVTRSGAALPTTFAQLWEQAVAGYVRAGVDVLLLVSLNGHTDLDYSELLKFHVQGGALLTHAYADDGALDLALVQTSQLRTVDGAYGRALSALIPRQSRFYYGGYVNRLATPQDCYALLEDGLSGRCDLRPVGALTHESVWQGTDCEIDENAVIAGPAFVGARSRIAAGCTIAPGAVIERDCEVDCSTTIQESWIQQNTYVGVALDVRRSIIARDTLFHLDRNIRVNIGEPNLIGTAATSSSLFAGLGSLLWGGERAA